MKDFWHVPIVPNLRGKNVRIYGLLVFCRLFSPTLVSLDVHILQEANRSLTDLSCLWR